jgi:hypothetical protein
MVAPPAIDTHDNVNVDLLSSSTNPTETFKLNVNCLTMDVPRVWTGLWQLSSPAWGTAPAARIRREMRKHVDKGFVAFGESLFVLAIVVIRNSRTRN